MNKITATELIELYEKWIIISESQLAFLSEDRLDENFNQLRMLETEKRQIRLMVMEYDISFYEQLEVVARERLTQAVLTLLSLNKKAEPYLKAWYEEAANEMKQVTTQQRILTSYGGAQSSDIISLYVDSKK